MTKKIKAEVVTAEEAVYLKEDGSHVTLMYEMIDGEYSGQSWAVFQGSKKKCEELAVSLNEGFDHFSLLDNSK